MKNRLLAAILTAALVLSILPVMAQEDAAAENDTLLTYITGVYGGIGMFKKDMSVFGGETVSRSQLAKLLYDMMNTGDIASDSARHYYDVKPDHSAYTEIETITALKLLSGDENGFFRPDDNTTYDEAVKTMVCAIGYKDLAEINGGFAIGYNIIAGQKKLLSGMSKTAGSEHITGRDMAVLVYNTLRTDVVEGSTYRYHNGDVSEIKTEKDTDLLYNLHDITVIKGVVEANETADIDGDAPCQKGRVKIDGTVYDAECSTEMLGYLADAYIKDTDSDDKPDTVLYIGIPDNYNEVITIDSDDIKSYNSLTYSYDKNSSVTISRNTKILYNGKCMSSYDETLMKPENGYVEILSRKGSGDYDVLFIHDRKTMVVERASALNNIISDRYNKSNYLVVDPDDTTKDIKILENGEEIKLTQISKDDVLTVERSQDGSLLRIFRSQKRVSGIVKVVSEDEITIGDKTYELLPGVVTKANLKAGDEITLLLDINGKGAGTSDSVSGDWSFGLVLGVDADRGMDAGMKLKIFTVNDTDVIYETAKNVILDGRKTENSKNVIKTRIESQSAPVLRYKLNAEGKISHIDTLQTDTGDSKNDTLFQMNDKAQRYYNASYYTFGQEINCGNNTVVFQINPTLTGEISEDYRIVSPGNITGDKVYTIESFTDSKKDITPDVIFMYYAGTGNGKISDTAKFMTIESVGTTIEDEMEYPSVTGFYDGYSQTFAMKDTLNTSGLRKGDIIRFGRGNDGRINAYEKVFDAKTKTLAYGSNPYDGNSGQGGGADFFAGLATVWRINDGQMVVTYDDSYQSETLPTGAKVWRIDSPPVYVYEINSRGEAVVTSAAVNDIVGYADSSEGASKILISAHWFGIKEVYIIK